MKISILMPAYNEEKNIAEAIASLLNQTKKADEIIIVDDASTDKTGSIVKSMRARYPQIKYIRRLKNGGVAEAFATGYKHVAGDIVIIFDADSVASEKWIEIICKEFQNKKIGSVGGPFLPKDTRKILPKLQKVLWSETIPEINKLRGRYKPSISGSNFAFSKKIADKIGITKKKPNFSYDRYIQEQMKHSGFDQVYLEDNPVYSKVNDSIYFYTKQWLRYGKGRPARQGLKLKSLTKQMFLFGLPFLVLFLLILNKQIGAGILVLFLLLILGLGLIPYIKSHRRTGFHLIVLSLLLYMYSKYVHAAGYLVYCIFEK